MWSKLPRMTEVRSMRLFLRPVDWVETIILMLITEAREGEPNCTRTSNASADIKLANISLVKLSHMVKTSITETGNICLVQYSNERNTAKDIKTGRDEKFETLIQIYHDIPRYFYSQFRDRKSDT